MRRFLLAFLILACTGTAPAQQKRIYIANDDHTDLLWSGSVAQYEQAFQGMIDFYLAQANATAGNPADFQGRFNLDGSYWLWVYENARTPAEFAQVIARLKDGHLSAPMTPLVILYGGTPAEAVLRGMYYAGRLERREGMRFRLATSMENQVLPWGLASLWAGSGATFSWKGVCACNSQVANSGDREHDIYYYTGPDGQRVLMKWNTLLGSNESMGGYAEARDPVAVVNLVSTSPAFQARYPYPVIGCFGKGWDDLETKTAEFITAAQSLSNASRRVIVSNEIDFFEDFEANHGNEIPSESRAYGNEWELYVASLAEVSASVKRSVERLRAAEAMAAITAPYDAGLLPGREAARDLAFMDLGLYWEHDWVANGVISRDEREAWQRQLAAEIAAYVEPLHADATAALGALIPASAGATRVFAFNPLGWPRSDAADLPWPNAAPVHAVENASGKEVPSQFVTLGGVQYLRILASDIPALGYRTYDILPGSGEAFGDAATALNGVLENSVYRVTVAGRGAITSLIDKTRGNVELAASVGGRFLNDLGAGSGTLTIENAGAVSVTLRADASGPVAHTSRVTLYRGSDRIDLDNEITQNFSQVLIWGFGFNLTAPDVRHEEVGAIARARRESDGGNYSARQARTDWLTLNHFADITGGAGVGMTIGNADTYFFRLGNSTVTTLDTATPSIAALAGGQVDGSEYGIQNQGGDTLFRQRFALRAHGAYDPAAAMRMSVEHQNPLVTGVATRFTPGFPIDRFEGIQISDPDVLLWAFKPAEEGIEQGVIARLWNVASAARSATIQLAPGTIEQAALVTHLETDEGALAIGPAGLAADFLPQQIRSFRLLPSAAAAADPDGDGVPDGFDCDGADASVWLTPGAVAGLTLAGDAPAPTMLTWFPPATPGATALRYDTLRSLDPTDFVFGAACVQWDDPLPVAAEPSRPPRLFYYLIRAENECPTGDGSLGADSAGVPREGTVCPSPTFDGDGDGYPQASDCSDADLSVWHAPGETLSLSVNHNRATGLTTLTWLPPDDLGGAAVVYDALRSTVASDFVGAAICGESNDGTNASALDNQSPALRESFFYLTRAENACPGGEGSLGLRSSGQPRLGRPCP